MKVQVDNKVVTMVLVSREVHQSNAVVYHELNEHGQPYREHSFAQDWLHVDGGFWMNGHHYRTGTMVGVPCTFKECDICPRQLVT